MSETRPGSHVGNGPSNNPPTYLSKKKLQTKTCEMQHGEHEALNMINETWHMTCDTWKEGGSDPSLKIFAP